MRFSQYIFILILPTLIIIISICYLSLIISHEIATSKFKPLYFSFCLMFITEMIIATRRWKIVRIRQRRLIEYLY